MIRTVTEELSFFETLLFATGIILTYALVNTFLRVNIIATIRDIFAAFRVGIERLSEYFSGVSNKRFGVESRKRKQKSILYRYNVFMVGIIQDLGFSSSITPEYISIFLVIGSLLIGLLCSKIVKNFFVRIMFFCTVYAAIVSVMYLMSRNKARRKTMALILAEDLLCQNIKSSMIKTVEACIDRIDPIARPYFQRYVVRVINQRVPAEDALAELNISLGPSFDDFCNKMYKLELEGKPGMIDTFKDNIDRNALIKKLYLEKDELNRRLNRNYLTCIGVIGAFLLGIILIFPSVAALFQTSVGQLLLVVVILVPVLVFCYCQYQQNKGYKEGEM